MRRLNFTNTQIASIQTARDINRGVVLNLIRRRQPISRADLARVSGLQRSTVSQIIEQLIRERWVVAGPTGRLPRRPPLGVKVGGLVIGYAPDGKTILSFDPKQGSLSSVSVTTDDAIGPHFSGFFAATVTVTRDFLPRLRVTCFWSSAATAAIRAAPVRLGPV